MKNIILISFVLLGFFTKAQQNELRQNNWYLQKIIIDNTKYITPINEEVSKIRIHFYSNYFTTTVCNIFSGSIQYYSSGPSFNVFYTDVTLMDCNISENYYFESSYFYQFFYHDSEIAGPFVYTIEDLVSYKTLEITNSAGDQAIYHTHNTVSISEFKHLKTKLIAYPNPATNKLFIRKLKNKGELSIIITNLLGQEIVSDIIISQETELDISHLEKGFYLVKIYDENELIVHTQKIIKG